VIDEVQFVAMYGTARVKGISFRRHQKAVIERVRRIDQVRPTIKPAKPVPATPKKPSFKAILPSTPFDEQNEDDPFDLFPEWCGPYSALRSDTTVYREQERNVKEFISKRPNLRHDTPLPLGVRQEMIHRCLRMGFFASPTKAARKRQQKAKSFESAALDAGSPMDLSD